jgi:acyl carrier protein
MSAEALLAAALGCALESIAADSAIGSVPAWDSLGHVKVVLAIEERLGRTLSTEEILEVTSIEAIARLLRDPSTN